MHPKSPLNSRILPQILIWATTEASLGESVKDEVDEEKGWEWYEVEGGWNYEEKMGKFLCVES